MEVVTNGGNDAYVEGRVLGASSLQFDIGSIELIGTFGNNAGSRTLDGINVPITRV